MSHLIREGDLDKDTQEPDSLTALSVDLTDPFTTRYKIAALQLGRRWFSVSVASAGQLCGDCTAVLLTG